MKNFAMTIFILIFVVALAIASITIFIRQPSDFAEFCSAKNPCDAVVAISGGNTEVRANFAGQILSQGVAKNIVFSGANANPNVISDAETMRRAVKKMGVEDSKITLEKNARNTEQNAQLTAKIIKQNGWRRVVLVTSPYHQRRAFLEFSKALQGANVEIFNAPAKIDPDWRASTWFLSPRGWYLTMAEFVGIIRFYLR